MVRPVPFRLTTALAAAAALALLAPPATAQLSVTSHTLWTDNSQDSDGTVHLWMQTGAAKPQYDSIIYLCTSGAVIPFTNYQPEPCGQNRPDPIVLDFPLQPALVAPVALDKTQSATMDLYLGAVACDIVVGLGCNSVPEAGSLDAAAQLVQGDTVVADGGSQTLTWGSGGAPANAQGTAQEILWTVNPQVAVLDPAKGNLDWKVTVTFPNAMDGMGIAVWMNNPASKVDLPVAAGNGAPGAHVVYGELSGASVDAQGQFTAATNDTYLYNWTTTATAVDIGIDATVGAGSVTYSIVDANGKPAATGTVSATAKDTHPVSGMAAGKWRVSLQYNGFRGTFKMSLAPHAASSTSSTSGGPAGGGGGPTPHATSSSTAAPMPGASSSSATTAAKKSPAASLLVLGAVLGVAVLRRRR